VVAAVVLAVGVGELTGLIPGSAFPGNDRVHAVFVIMTAAPLVLRRAYPLSTMLVTVAITTVWQYAMYSEEQQPPFEAFIALLIAVFGAGVYTAGRSARAAVVTVALGSLVTVIDILAGKPVGQAVPPTVMIIGVFLLGRLLAGYRIQAEQSAVRADRVAREHEASRERALADERARIARELHDVISHDVSLIVMQASIERRMRAGRSTDSDDVLASIETVGRDALAELRRMLGVLRSPDSTAPMQPQAGLGQLDGLVAQCRDAGLGVRLVTEGDPADHPAGLDLTAYRVVQESLTNVAKHAGRGHAVATIRHRSDHVEIEVVDDGAGDRETRIDAPPGHGLVGMRERVALYGGTVEAGPQQAGAGFRVLVRLPLGPS
jgi:signal transduction histidine kinase